MKNKRNEEGREETPIYLRDGRENWFNLVREFRDNHGLYGAQQNYLSQMQELFEKYDDDFRNTDKFKEIEGGSKINSEVRSKLQKKVGKTDGILSHGLWSGDSLFGHSTHYSLRSALNYPRKLFPGLLKVVPNLEQITEEIKFRGTRYVDCKTKKQAYSDIQRPLLFNQYDKFLEVTSNVSSKDLFVDSVKAGKSISLFDTPTLLLDFYKWIDDDLVEKGTKSQDYKNWQLIESDLLKFRRYDCKLNGAEYINDNERELLDSHERLIEEITYLYADEKSPRAEEKKATNLETKWWNLYRSNWNSYSESFLEILDEAGIKGEERK